MRYSVCLVIGFARAIFWSGGWYWRLPLLVGFLPGVRQEVQPVLELFGLADTPSHWFYIFASVGAAIIFAVRISYIETLRIYPLRIIKYRDRDKLKFRIQVKNKSLSKCQGILARIIRIEGFDFGLDQLDLNLPDTPFVLLTQERARYTNSKEVPDDRHRWSLSQGEEKNVEVFWTCIDRLVLNIPHQSGEQELTISDMTMKISLSGAGRPVEFWICYFEHDGVETALLLRDSFDFLVMAQFSKIDFSGERHGTR